MLFAGTVPGLDVDMDVGRDAGPEKLIGSHKEPRAKPRGEVLARSPPFFSASAPTDVGFLWNITFQLYSG